MRETECLGGTTCKREREKEGDRERERKKETSTCVLILLNTPVYVSSYYNETCMCPHTTPKPVYMCPHTSSSIDLMKARA